MQNEGESHVSLVNCVTLWYSFLRIKSLLFGHLVKSIAFILYYINALK